MDQITTMFKHRGKTSKLIGPQRLKAYESVFNYISNMQKQNDLPAHDDYLGDNELAKNIYEKKILFKKFKKRTY